MHSPSWPTRFAATMEHKNRVELQNKYVANNETLLELAQFLISKDNLQEQNPKPKELLKKECIPKEIGNCKKEDWSNFNILITEKHLQKSC